MTNEEMRQLLAAMIDEHGIGTVLSIVSDLEKDVSIQWQ
jgi:hypothetical protein